MIEKP
jgi:hypothetical protein